MKLRNLIAVGLLLAMPIGASADVQVKLDADASFSVAVKNRIAASAGKILTEINNAFAQNRPINMVGLPIEASAKDDLGVLWSVSHFYCDDEQINERLWNFSNGTCMIRQIPLLIEANGVQHFQEAVMEFDRIGNLTELRFTLGNQISAESYENCGSAVDYERKMQILAWLERFRTAYNKKDMTFLQQVYSEDALIITGKVMTARDGGISVSYNRESKTQYLTRLARIFRMNSWIKVEFEAVAEGNGACPGITQSKVNKNFYGVRVLQHWNTERYSDVGYLFLLWDFTNEQSPQIHVRTWQPQEIQPGKKIAEEDIFDIVQFEDDIKRVSSH